MMNKAISIALLLGSFNSLAMEIANKPAKQSKKNTLTILGPCDYATWCPKSITRFQEIEQAYFNPNSNEKEIDQNFKRLMTLAYRDPGFPPALHLLSRILYHGWGHIKPDFEQAENMLLQAAQSGYSYSEYEFALLLLHRAATLRIYNFLGYQLVPPAYLLELLYQSPPMNNGMARVYLTQLIPQRKPPLFKQTVLGPLDYISYPPEQIREFQIIENIYCEPQANAQKILESFQKLEKLAYAEPVFIPACYLIGLIYFSGWGPIYPNFHEGEKALYMAARAGHVYAQDQLGLLYLHRAAVPRYINDYEAYQLIPAAHMVNLYYQYPPPFNNVMAFILSPPFLQNNLAQIIDFTQVNKTNKDEAIEKIYEDLKIKDSDKACQLLEGLLNDSIPQNLCNFIQCKSYTLLSQLAEHKGNLKINYLLGLLWQKISDFDEGDRAVILDVAGCENIQDSQEYCRQTAYNYFSFAAQNGSSQAWIMLGSLLKNGNAPRTAKKEPAACFYKAYEHAKENNLKDTALFNLLSLAHLHGNGKADMKAVIRLILICRKDECILKEYLQKILLKILSASQGEKKEISQIVKNELKMIIDLNGTKDLRYLFGKLLYQLGDAKLACEYLEDFAFQNTLAAWFYLKILIELKEINKASSFVKKISPIGAQENSLEEDDHQNTVLKKLKRLSIQDGRYSYLLNELYSGGVLMKANEQKADKYLKQAADLNHTAALWILLENNEKQMEMNEIMELLFSFVGTEYHESCIEKISNLLDKNESPVESYYKIIEKVLDHDSGIALKAFKKAEDWLMKNKELISQEQGELVYTSGVYKRLALYAENNEVYIALALAQMHLDRVLYNYAIKSSVNEEWERGIKFLEKVPNEDLSKMGYDITQQKCDLMKSYFREGNIEKVAEFANDLKKVNPYGTILYAYCCILEKINTIDDGINIIEEFLQKKAYEKSQHLTDLLSEITYSLGNFYYQDQNLQKAQLWYQQSANLDNKKAGTLLKEVKIKQEQLSLYNRGIQFFELNKLAEAEELFNKIHPAIDIERWHRVKGYLSLIDFFRHYNNDGTNFEKVSFNTVLDKFVYFLSNVFIYNLIQYEDLIHKIFDAMEELEKGHPEVGYYRARFQILKAFQEGNFQNINESLALVRETDKKCSINYQLKYHIYQSGCYQILKNILSSERLSEKSRYAIINSLYWIHSVRIYAESEEERAENLKKAKELCVQLEDFSESDSEPEDLFRVYLNLSRIVRYDDPPEELKFIRKALKVNRLNSELLCRHAELCLKLPEFAKQKHLFDLVLSDLKKLSDAQPQDRFAAKAKLLLAQIWIGEIVNKWFKVTNKSIQEGYNLLIELSSDDENDLDIKIENDLTLAKLYLLGRGNIKNDAASAFDLFLKHVRHGIVNLMMPIALDLKLFDIFVDLSSKGFIYADMALGDFWITYALSGSSDHAKESLKKSRTYFTRFLLGAYGLKLPIARIELKLANIEITFARIESEESEIKKACLKAFNCLKRYLESNEVLEEMKKTVGNMIKQIFNSASNLSEEAKEQIFKQKRDEIDPLCAKFDWNFDWENY